MPLIAAKAAWQVTAGVVPGVGIAEYTKRYDYNSAEYEEDGKHRTDPAYLPIFMQRMALATEYFTQINNPAYVNWVHLEFIWF